MPWALVAILSVYGLLCLVFAVVEPPASVRSLFPIPSIFVFLPDRFIVPIGRVFVGLCALGLAGFIAKQFLAAPPP
jgi:hypothetical protein